MERTRLIYLHQQFLDQTATGEEMQEFRKYLSDPEAEVILKALADIDWELAKNEQVEQPQNYEWIYEQIIDSPQERRKSSKLWARIAVAAALAVIVFGSGLFYFNKNNSQNHPAPAYGNDIAPGKQGATLTLSGGKKIRLSDRKNGELAKEAGISISKTADGQVVYEAKENSGASDQVNTLSTGKGETYILTLPDKSRVWMNAASSLTYSPRLIEDGMRKVKLKGEAYFEIAKDKTHPFIVQDKRQEVQVLGTHFNVNNYPDEPASKTTLLEGSVKLVAGEKVEKLLPGQQALVRDGKIMISNADLAEITAWKNGNFVFNGQDIPGIMRQLQRWYDIEVVYEGEIPQEKYYADISRFTNISQILRSLENAQGVRFQIIGRRVIVRK